MSKYTSAQAGCIKRYLDKFEDMRIRVTPADKARYKAAADAAGLSLTKFIISAIEEKIERGC